MQTPGTPEADRWLWCQRQLEEVIGNVTDEVSVERGLLVVHALWGIQGKRSLAREEMSKMIALCPGLALAYEKRAEYSDDKGDILQDLATVTHLDPLRTYPYRYRAAGMLLAAFPRPSYFPRSIRVPQVLPVTACLHLHLPLAMPCGGNAIDAHVTWLSWQLSAAGVQCNALHPFCQP